MDAVKGFEPSRPIRLDAAPFNNGKRRSVRSAGHRPHGKPATAQPRHAHAWSEAASQCGRQASGGRRDSARVITR
jgi:ATP-dependent RNA helicase RhlE